MGKSIIVKGADFSANAIQEPVVLDITSLVDASGKFFPQAMVTSFNMNGTNASNTRCAVVRLCVPDLVPDVTIYDKIRIEVRNGYDFALGMFIDASGIADASNWFKLDGNNSSGGTFAWVTDKQWAEVDVEPIMYITGNFRYDDNTTEFAASAKFSDMASIYLIRSGE